MRTDPIRYAERHNAICARAEREFLNGRKKNPQLTLPKTVTGYAAAIRCAIARRDGTGIAGILAAQCAHVVLQFSRRQCSPDLQAISKRHVGDSIHRAPARRVIDQSSGGVYRVAIAAPTTRCQTARRL
jgi:hypothetical protein